MNNKYISRKKNLLKYIIESFISDNKPVSSKYIKKKYNVNISEATIRNDMQDLENDGYIFSPHTSAGRVPTEKAFREYVDNLTNFRDQKYINKQRKIALDDLLKGNIDDILYNSVSILSKYTNEIAFATIPSKKQAFYLGIANIIKTKEFLLDNVKIHSIIEVLEDKNNFIEKLNNINIDENIKVYIGKENLLPQIDSVAMIVSKYTLQNKGVSGHIGILGPIRMNYPYNMALLDLVKSKISVFLLK